MVEETVLITQTENNSDLASRAEDAFACFKGDALKEHFCERMFRALTQKSADGSYTARELPFGDLRRICESDPERLIAIIDIFRKRKTNILLPVYKKAIKEDTIISLADDRLIETWERFAVWAGEEKASVEAYHELAVDAERFMNGEQGYLTDPRLTEGLKWFNNNFPNAYWAAQFEPQFDETIDYLFQSMEQANIAAVENENIEIQARALGFWVSRVAKLAALVAIVTGAYVFWPSGLFDQKAQMPVTTTNLAEKSEASHLTGEKDNYDSFVANLARQKAQEHAEKTGEPGIDATMPEIKSPDEKIWWETPENDKIASVEGFPGIEIPDFLQGETAGMAKMPVLVPAKEQQNLKENKTEKIAGEIEKTPTPQVLKPVEKPKPVPIELQGEITLDLKSSVRDFAFHPNRGELIAGCSNGIIQKIRVIDGKLKKSGSTLLKNEQILSLDYSRDAKYIAVGTESGQLVILSNSGGKLTEIFRHSFNKAIQQVGFLASSDGQYLAVGNVDLVSIVKIEDHQVVVTDEVTHAHIGSMNVGKGGNHILVADLNRCYIYQISGNGSKFQSPTIVKTTANISSLALDRRANLLATGMVNGQLLLFKLDNAYQTLDSKSLSVHRSLISSLDFHRNGSSVQLVTSGFDQTLTLIDVPATMSGNQSEDHLTLKGHNKWVYKGKFGNTGKYMISSSEDGQIFIWDTDPDKLGDGTLGFKR